MRGNEHRSFGLRVRRGFTLIELLLVTVILSVLAGIVLVRFGGRTESTKRDAAKTQISVFSTALGIFEVDNGRFPSTEETLNALIQAGSFQNWHGPSLDKNFLPDDPWGHPYVYECPGPHNHNSFDLFSAGPDGREGTEDDIDNWSKQ